MSALRMILPGCVSIGCERIHYREEGIPVSCFVVGGRVRRRRGGHSPVGTPSGFHERFLMELFQSETIWDRYERIPIHHEAIYY